MGTVWAQRIYHIPTWTLWGREAPVNPLFFAVAPIALGPKFRETPTLEGPDTCANAACRRSAIQRRSWVAMSGLEVTKRVRNWL